jgi:hypothetical protein
VGKKELKKNIFNIDYDAIIAKVVEENGHLVEGEFDEKIDENAIPRGGTSDTTRRWNYKMIISIDTSFCNFYHL